MCMTRYEFKDGVFYEDGIIVTDSDKLKKLQAIQNTIEGFIEKDEEVT